MDKNKSYELTTLNKELSFQNEEKKKCAAELVVADKELAFQKKEKGSRAAELLIANKELIFQNAEKEKLAGELIIANKELAEKEFFLSESQRVGSVGSYKENFVAGYWKSSEELDKIYGIDKKYNRTVKGWLYLVHPDDKQKMDAYLRLEVLGKQKSFDKEYRIIRINDKQTRWVHGLGEFKFDEGGAITEMIGTIQDITERKKAEDTLRKSLKELSDYKAATNEAAIVANTDTKGIITFANDNFCKISGYNREELIGQNHRILNSGYHPEEYFQDLWKTIAKGKIWRGEIKNKAKDGTYYWVDTTIAPLMNEQRKPVQYLAIRVDITERKKAEEKILKSNERYEFVNKATHDTIWEWDFVAKEGQYGDGIINTFGYSRDKSKYDESWVDEYVHPSDKEELTRTLLTHIESGMENWEHEFRFRCADNTYKYVYDRGFILYNKHGKPYRMIGAMSDVTEKRKLEEELITQRLQQQKLILGTTIQAQEKEKNRLGRELHDNINPIMATIKMFLGVVKSGKVFEEDLLGKSYEYINIAMEETRKLAHSLVAPSLGDIGLKEVLEELVENANMLSGMHVQLNIDEKKNEKKIDENKELMFYRIVQEQMNNIVKYANATEVTITLKTVNKNMVLSVTDNGIGFDNKQKKKGIGLKNIASRVELYSGSSNIISAPGKGCTLEVLLPC